MGKPKVRKIDEEQILLLLEAYKIECLMFDVNSFGQACIALFDCRELTI